MIHWPYEKLARAVKRSGLKPDTIKALKITGTVTLTTRDWVGAFPLADFVALETAEYDLKQTLNLVAHDVQWRKENGL